MTIPGQATLEEVLPRLATPSHVEIVRAKRLILSIVDDDEAHGIQDLQAALINAEGIRKPDFKQEKLVFGQIDDLDEAEVRNHLVIRWTRAARAGAEAVVELESQGTLVEVSLPGGQPGHPLVGNTVGIPVQVRNHSSGIRVETFLPTFADGYRLAPRFRTADVPWFADPDIFIEDLDVLQLDVRTRRAVAEALESFRRGLHLAAANLLGAASEGAWFQAAERLAPFDRKVSKALEDDSQAAQVQERVVEVLRRAKTIKATEVAALHSQAELLRQLRNYGAHPRSTETEHLERYFSESAIGLLLLETHSYLTRLGEAVEAAIEELET